MTKIIRKFDELKKLRAKQISVGFQWKKANQFLSEDRHTYAGKLYEIQNKINDTLDELILLVEREKSNGTP